MSIEFIPTHSPESGASSGPTSGSLIGRTLKGTYRIVRRIAQGGMGVVYEAQHVRLGRRVAVKLLLDVPEDLPETLERIRREAGIVAQLEHPHIVQILDVDDAEYGPFLVMEYLEGRTVAERLSADDPLPVLEAVRIVTETASALAGAHARGIVHCDIKPANLFLVRVHHQPEFVKLLDFGVSTEVGRVSDPDSADSAQREARADRIEGTPDYMAPEQFGGSSKATPLTDQFALAAVLFELLSGRKAVGTRSGSPFLRTALLPVSAIAPWVPAGFDRVLGRALSVKPEDRFADISAFAAAVQEAARGCTADSEGSPRPQSRPSSASATLAESVEPASEAAALLGTLRSFEPPTRRETPRSSNVPCHQAAT